MYLSFELNPTVFKIQFFLIHIHCTVTNIDRSDSVGILKYNKLLRKLICYKIVGITFFLVDFRTQASNWASKWA